jgi:phosphoesterase RecJ-like protein
MNDRSEILARLSGDEKFLITTHENPDGDAIGSLVAMDGILNGLGKDTLRYMHERDFPLPYEYRNLLDAADVITEPPADLAERTVIYLDCGSFERMNVPEFRDGGKLLVNIDHHKDNDGYGDLALVESARSSTAELVYTIARDLEVPITRAMADALYVGLVTDTGRFMYQNTGPEAHEMAAELLKLGVDVHDTNTRLYEDNPVGKTRLLARALASLTQYDDGVLTAVNLTRDDFAEVGAEESFTEGIVDHARSVQGTLVGAMYRELTDVGREHLAKLSLRSSDDRVDVAVIAAGFGGGGHRQAAGATTELTLEQAVEQIRAAIKEQLAAAAR